MNEDRLSVYFLWCIKRSLQCSASFSFYCCTLLLARIAFAIKTSFFSLFTADATFLHTFLNTYRSFISPASLIDKLIFRYNQFSNSTEKTDIVRQAVASKVVTFIVLVVNEF